MKRNWLGLTWIYALSIYAPNKIGITCIFSSDWKLLKAPIQMSPDPFWCHPMPRTELFWSMGTGMDISSGVQNPWTQQNHMGVMIWFSPNPLNHTTIAQFGDTLTWILHPFRLIYVLLHLNVCDVLTEESYWVPITIYILLRHYLVSWTSIAS